MMYECHEGFIEISLEGAFSEEINLINVLDTKQEKIIATALTPNLFSALMNSEELNKVQLQDVYNVSQHSLSKPVERIADERTIVENGSSLDEGCKAILNSSDECYLLSPSSLRLLVEYAEVLLDDEYRLRIESISWDEQRDEKSLVVYPEEI